MKCVLLLSLAALTCAVPLTPDGPNIRFEKNDSIYMTGYDGQKLLISRNIKNDGSNYVEISVTDLQGRTNTFRIDQENNLRLVKVPDTASGDLKGIDLKKLKTSPEESEKGRTESDILKEVFQEFQSAAGLKEYENILRKIDSYIKSGDLDSSIFEVLKSIAKYEALNPESLYLGQANIVSKPNVGYYPRQTYISYYLNTAIDEQQRENDAKYGVRQPMSELSQGSIYYNGNPFLFRGVPLTSQRIVQWPQVGVNGKSLQQYSDSYGQIQKQQLAPVQGSQQYPQQALQPSSRPYQLVSQPLQQWNLPQPLWSFPKQQLAQERQKLIWDQVQRLQQLTEPQQLPQEQQLKSQGLLTQPREQLNFLGQDWVLPKRESSQDLSWIQAQKQQQYYQPQQQLIESQKPKKLVQQQYFRPEQVYADYISNGEQLPQSQGYLWNQNQPQQLNEPQQQWIRSQILQPQLDLVYQQERPLGQQRTISNQQLDQEQLGLPLGQQTQGNIISSYYWQSPLAAQLRQ